MTETIAPRALRKIAPKEHQKVSALVSQEPTKITPQQPTKPPKIVIDTNEQPKFQISINPVNWIKLIRKINPIFKHDAQSLKFVVQFFIDNKLVLQNNCNVLDLMLPPAKQLKFVNEFMVMKNELIRPLSLNNPVIDPKLIELTPNVPDNYHNQLALQNNSNVTDRMVPPTKQVRFDDQFTETTKQSVNDLIQPLSTNNPFTGSKNLSIHPSPTDNFYYKNPQTQYQKFVNAVCKCAIAEDGSCIAEKMHLGDKANALWIQWKEKPAVEIELEIRRLNEIIPKNLPSTPHHATTLEGNVRDLEGYARYFITYFNTFSFLRRIRPSFFKCSKDLKVMMKIETKVFLKQTIGEVFFKKCIIETTKKDGQPHISYGSNFQ